MTVRLLLVAAIAATPEITSFPTVAITTVQPLLAWTMAVLFVNAAVVMFATVSLAITETVTDRLLDVLQVLLSFFPIGQGGLSDRIIHSELSGCPLNPFSPDNLSDKTASSNHPSPGKQS